MSRPALQQYRRCTGIACLVLFSALLSPSLTRAQSAENPSAQSTDALHKLNESVDNLIKKVSPSVVQILVTGYGPLEEGDRGSTSVIIGRQRAIGSGFVIDPSGYIVTNAHVVNGAQRVRVVLPLMTNESSAAAALSTRSNIVAARVVGVARDIDLALLKIDDTMNLPALPVAAYRNLHQGEIVFAFGSPEGLRNTVTMGVISAVARQTDLDSPMVYVQTDAPINPGNSGGPLVNVNGEVVGVNTFILSQSGGNEGLGFAIPSSVVNVAYRQLRQFGHLHKTEIGIGIQTITPSLAAALKLPRAYGVIISDVKPGTPATAAGVQIGDVLLSVDGRSAENLPFVGLQFLSRESGDKIHLEVLRGKEKLSFDVNAMEPPREPALKCPWLQAT
jgi:serine protease Do